MRGIDCPIEKEWFVLVCFDEFLAFLNHHVQKELTVTMNLCSVAPKIMTIWPYPIKKVRIIVDAATHVAERRIKALPVGHGVRGKAKVPFPNVACCIALRFQ